mmetsp:Transcript_8911/g.14114  ORF Transcript_8911/g.14114 Transcript_8911/m.14114 type:complete len:116 (+) Transcript_8911:527-874(+)
MALGALGSQLVRMLFQEVLVQEGLIFEELAAKVERATGAAVLVVDAVVFNPFFASLFFGHLDGVGDGVSFSVDEAGWALFLKYLTMLESLGYTVIESGDKHILWSNRFRVFRSSS